MIGDRKHIVLINGIYPPDNGASGREANQFAGRLIQTGIDVTIVTTDRSYNAQANNHSYNGKVIRVKSRSLGPSKLFRLAASFWESYFLLKKAKSLKPDTFIVCTDPPLLNWYSSMMLQGEKWIMWTMDLYPEAFVANKLISDKSWIKGSWINSLYERRLKNNPPTALMYLGEKQREFVQNKYGFFGIPNFIISCGIRENINQKSGDIPDWKTDSTRTYFAYCGNLGEAHSKEFLIGLIDLSDPNKHCFVLNLFGARAEEVKRSVGNKKNVHVVPWIEDGDMRLIDIQIVTLKKEWTHICVPSKAISSICYTTPIIFHGSPKGDINNSLSESSWFIEDGKDLDNRIKIFYDSLSAESITIRKKKALMLKKSMLKEYDESITQITKYLKE